MRNSRADACEISRSQNHAAEMVDMAVDDIVRPEVTNGSSETAGVPQAPCRRGHRNYSTAESRYLVVIGRRHVTVNQKVERKSLTID
jgi:hypothetical protein